MTLQLDLPADVEHALRARAAAAGQDVSAYVAEVVAERLAEVEPVPPKSASVRSQRRFAERLRAFVALHPGSGGTLDDSRESIYAGRGE